MADSPALLRLWKDCDDRCEATLGTGDCTCGAVHFNAGLGAMAEALRGEVVVADERLAAANRRIAALMQFSEAWGRSLCSLIERHASAADDMQMTATLTLRAPVGALRDLSALMPPVVERALAVEEVRRG